MIAERVWLRAVSSQVPASPDRQSVAARAALAVIRFYQRFISPALPRMCRFHPSCSAYAQEAVTRYGFLRGAGMAVVRLCKCHPLHKGGFDPVK